MSSRWVERFFFSLGGEVEVEFCECVLCMCMCMNDAVSNCLDFRLIMGIMRFAAEIET